MAGRHSMLTNTHPYCVTPIPQTLRLGQWLLRSPACSDQPQRPPAAASPRLSPPPRDTAGAPWRGAGEEEEEEEEEIINC